MFVYRYVWATGAIVLTLAGGTVALLGLTPALVVQAVVIGLLSSALATVTHGRAESLTPTQQPPPVAQQLPAVAAGFTAVLVGAGLGTVAGPIGSLVVVLMVAVSPCALRYYAVVCRWHRERSQPATAQPPQAEQAPGAAYNLVGPTPARLRSMSDQELCWTWRRSFSALEQADGASDRIAITEAREAYLDELQRRDPAGFACWMAAGARAGSDPTRYVGHPHGG